nr:methyltransferase domain-containing protein [Candidatus Njordarchaeota archaeon]
MSQEYYSYMKKLFRAWAPFYGFLEAFIPRLRDNVVDLINARSGSRVLDVGTGTGKLAFAFAKRRYYVVGVDLSEDMLRVARKNNKYKNVKFELVDATRMPFDDSYFDVSCASFLLHDMPLVLEEKTLKEMVRVTRPKGIIAIVDYALPESRIIKYVAYHFIRLYESRYYPDFVKKFELEATLRRLRTEIKEEIPILHGAGRILIAANLKENP